MSTNPPASVASAANVASTGSPASAGSQRPLGVLESSGLIKLAATQPELEYLFRHVLVQDAAYDTLLKQERRRLHITVAETLEALYPERLDELAAMLAWHYQEAEETERTLPWLIRAGHYALKRYANTEAFSFFGRAEALAPEGDDPAALRERLEIALGKGRAGWLFKPPAEQLVEIEALAPTAEALGDPDLIGQVALWTAILQWMRGDQYQDGSPFKGSLDRALEMARVADDRQLRGAALTILGRSSLLSTDPRRSAMALEEAIGLTEGNDYIGTSLAADTLAMAYSALGEWNKAEAALRRAHELAVQSGDPVAAVDADLASSASAIERGDLEEAVRLARSGAVRADALGAVACSVFANYLTGVAELQLGRPDRAVGPLQYSQDLGRENKIDMWRDVTQASISASQCALGDISTAMEGWDRSLEAARKNHDTGAEALIRYQRAKWLATTPDPDWDPILADFEASIELFRGLGLRPREAAALEEYAGILERLGRSAAEANAARGRADELLREMGMSAVDVEDRLASTTG